MARNTLETLMGAVVLLVAAWFLWLVYSASAIQSGGSIRINAEFGSIGGLNTGDAVQISGITVGRVVETRLNASQYTARITMTVDDTIPIPSDSSARIVASSLLGGNHVEILPGFEEDTIADGGVIFDTRDPVNFTDLLGKAVLGSGGGE